jgi:phage-related protein
METILYITGGIALLALAWLFIALTKALKGMQSMVAQLETDFHTAAMAADEIRTGMMPILGNLTAITSNVTNITHNVSKIISGVQNQMVGVHETIDDALDVIRGTIDDIERVKNEVVATVEGPITMVRETANGAFGTAARVVSLVLKLVGNRKKKSSMNGRG